MSDEKDNIWLLTEERPKPSVILQIIETYCKDFNDEITVNNKIKIKPIINNGIFQFLYLVEGLATKESDHIYIKTVSGSSSFFDFLLFKQKEAPIEGGKETPLMAIEETKTSDDESRNTGVYQRGSKFVFIHQYYIDTKLYMLYNDELEAREDKRPSDTSIFGTNILLTLGATIVGKDTTRWFKPFKSLDELIDFKAKMRRPPAGNTPILITKYTDRIEISGRLSNPAEKENIAHDPNIGALSMISACIRKLGWDKKIVVTLHGVSQSYVDRSGAGNKFVYICKLLDISLDNITLPIAVETPERYWHYEINSEKMADILLHVQVMYYDIKCVYENHAGCERGYFRSKTNELIVLPKRDSHGNILSLPDVVLYDDASNETLVVEGKKLSTLNQGLSELNNYDSIENEHIKPNYPGTRIQRGLSIFGGECKKLPHEKVLFYLADNGKIIINRDAPDFVKQCFANTGAIIQQYSQED